MSLKNIFLLFILFAIILLFNVPVFAQETFPSTSSGQAISTQESNPDALASSTPPNNPLSAGADTSATTSPAAVPDTTPPTILLNGPATLEMFVGDPYTDAGATASDDIDGDITGNIIVVNPVNTAQQGEYHITYNVSDSAGNQAQEVMRTVVVLESPAKKTSPSEQSSSPEENSSAENQTIEQSSPPPPEPPSVPAVQPVVPFESRDGRAFDPATAPSRVIIRVLMPDGNPPPFPVFVTFVGVGRKNYGGKIDANGELNVIMPTGRYYTELLILNTEYVQGEDGPSFFLEANEERDFGAIKLIPASERKSKSLEDRSLEANLLAEAENTKGVGKILLLIVKLLIKILEEIRSISSRI